MKLHESALTEKQIAALKKMYDTGKFSHRDLARMVNVDKSQISRYFQKMKPITTEDQSWKQ
jgi:predicted transcriptional regulator